MLMEQYLSFRDGLALALQAIIATGTANGADIVAPGCDGRSLEITLIAGDLTGVTVLTIVIQGKRSDTAAYETIQDNTGSDLAFTASKTIAGGQLDDGILRGTIPMVRLPGDPLNKDYTYTDYRVAVTVVTGATVNIAASYRVVDLFKEPYSPDLDDLVAKVLPAG